MRCFRLPLCIVGLAFSVFGQVVSSSNTSGSLGKETPGFDLSAIDRAASPCQDFYQYACGSWLKNNPIPSDQASWGRFSELHERNQTILREVLEQDTVRKNRSGDDQKLGDYYGACMDQKAIEAKGTAPLRPLFEAIDALKASQEMAGEVARLHRMGVNVLFNFSSGQDAKDSNAVIGQADQGGLGLPEKDYYFRDDPKAVETRKEYVAHVARLMQLLGSSPEAAKQQADTVMKIETALAKASQDVVTRRDPEKTYHKMKLTEFEALSDSFNWSRYFAAIQSPAIDSLNVASPDFFKGQESLLKTIPLAEWKTYFKLHTTSAMTEMLPVKFQDEAFTFRKFLTGAKEMRPRWKRCVAATDGDLGELLGKAYVEKTFGAEGKQRTLDMVKKLETSLGQDIQQLPWMTPATKQKAIEKLHGITNKIGYPDQWRNYAGLQVIAGDAVGNSVRANEFEFNRQLQKIGKPVDRKEWFMTPPTVNAYYDPQMNNINFPAGILQPPFFDKKADDAVNYGAIGAVIGHELTHGFDDEGRQFDAEGNLKDWWTPEDTKKFEDRVDCIVKEYESYTLPGGVHMNGKLTLGENTADNGGVRIAWMALMNDLAGKTLPNKDGFSTAQRFFLGFGQIWCTNDTEEMMRLQAQTNPHAIDKYRVQGTLQNMPEFQKAFGCKAGQSMVSPNACRVW